MLTLTIFAVFVLAGIALKMYYGDLDLLFGGGLIGAYIAFIAGYVAYESAPGTTEETFTYHDLVTNTDYVCTRPALPTYDGSWILPGLSINRFDSDDSHATCYERN